MSLKNFQKWIETCPLKDWVELYDDDQFIVVQFNKEINENDCPDKLEPDYLPKTAVTVLQNKYGSKKYKN